MKNSKLHYRFLKEKSEVSRKTYTMQRNYFVHPKWITKRITKREYFAKLKFNNKIFLKTGKPLFYLVK